MKRWTNKEFHLKIVIEFPGAKRVENNYGLEHSRYTTKA